MFLCDLNNVDTKLISARSESCVHSFFFLIPFVVIKSCVIALLQQDFHFSSLLWTETPVAYFQLMYSWVLQAYCVSCRESF